MLYMDGNGKVWFGVYNGAYVTLGSTATLNDGNWHMAVGTVGAAGTRLYIDGVLNASNAGNTAAEATTGVWRAGCGNLAGWGGSWGGGNNPTTDSTSSRTGLPGLARRVHRLQLRDVRRQHPVPQLDPLSRGGSAAPGGASGRESGAGDAAFGQMVDGWHN